MLEIATLRQQIEVYRRQVKRPKIQRSDRMFWIWLQRHWPGLKNALLIVKPETVLRWHREGYRAQHEHHPSVGLHHDYRLAA